MEQSKTLDFSGTTIFCGVDVHKKNWRVNIQDADFELDDFSQDPDPDTLYKHLVRRYPGAKYKVCYEAGFSGFSAQRRLSNHGVDCLIVNAADVATNHKERRQKNDKIDARKLCEHLQSKKVRGIYIPEPHWEHSRSMVRMREKFVRNQTRAKNRIWHLLHYTGIRVAERYAPAQHWSSNFIKDLEGLDCPDNITKTTLQLYITDFKQTRDLLVKTTRCIREMCRSELYEEQLRLLRSIPGIGEINGAIILFEIQDINRFKRFDNLCSYVGLVPDTSDSGDTRISKGITVRRNNFLRVSLVESSWTVIRKDPAMLMKYKEYCKRMDKNKAIIRIAKHLLSRISYVLKSKQEYVPGIVA